MKKKTIKRVLLAVLSLTMLLCVLTGCFGGTSTESGVKVPMGDSPTEQATYAAELLMTDGNALEAFLAASRGYNMYDPNFKDYDLNNDGQKDGDLPAADLGFVHIDAAKVALTKVQPTDATYLTKIYKNLDADMVHRHGQQSQQLEPVAVASLHGRHLLFAYYKIPLPKKQEIKMYEK